MKLLCLLIEPIYLHEKTLKTHGDILWDTFVSIWSYFGFGGGGCVTMWRLLGVVTDYCHAQIIHFTLCHLDFPQGNPLHLTWVWPQSGHHPAAAAVTTCQNHWLFRGTCLHSLGVAEEAGWYNNVLREIIQDNGRDSSSGRWLPWTESSAQCPLRRWSTAKLWIQKLERKVSKQRKM